MRFLRQLVTLVPLCLMAACTAVSKDVPSLTETLRETTGQNGRACVRTRDIRGYGVRDNNVVNINASRGYYLATVHPGCFDLDTSMAVLFGGSYSEICGGRMDKVVTGEGQCTINQVFKFDSREAAFAAYEAALIEREERPKR